MPVIRQNKEQQQALEYVTKTLEIASAMAAVTDGSWSGTATIQFATPGKPKRGGLKVTLDEGDKEIGNLLKLLRSHRQRICKEAIAQAQKHSIDLTDEELAILSGENRQKDDNDDVEAPQTNPAGTQDQPAGTETSAEETAQTDKQGEEGPVQTAPQPTPPAPSSDFIPTSAAPAEDQGEDDEDDSDEEFEKAMGQLRG